MDSHKLKGQLLKEQLVELERKKEDLEVQLNEANLSFPEAETVFLPESKRIMQSLPTMRRELRKSEKILITTKRSSENSRIPMKTKRNLRRKRKSMKFSSRRTRK